MRACATRAPVADVLAALFVIVCVQASLLQDTLAHLRPDPATLTPMPTVVTLKANVSSWVNSNAIPRRLISCAIGMTSDGTQCVLPATECHNGKQAVAPGICCPPDSTLDVSTGGCTARCSVGMTFDGTHCVLPTTECHSGKHAVAPGICCPPDSTLDVNTGGCTTDVCQPGYVRSGDTCERLQSNQGGLVVTPTSLLFVEGATAAASYNVSLAVAPVSTARFFITVAPPSSAHRVAVDHTTLDSALVFTPDNWATPVTVHIAAVDNAATSGTVVLTLHHSVDTKDSLFAAITDTYPVEVTVKDLHDTAGITVAPGDSCRIISLIVVAVLLACLLCLLMACGWLRYGKGGEQRQHSTQRPAISVTAAPDSRMVVLQERDIELGRDGAARVTDQGMGLPGAPRRLLNVEGVAPVVLAGEGETEARNNLEAANELEEDDSMLVFAADAGVGAAAWAVAVAAAAIAAEQSGGGNGGGVGAGAGAGAGVRAENGAGDADADRFARAGAATAAADAEAGVTGAAA